MSFKCCQENLEFAYDGFAYSVPNFAGQVGINQN